MCTSTTSGIESNDCTTHPHTCACTPVRHRSDLLLDELKNRCVSVVPLRGGNAHIVTGHSSQDLHASGVLRSKNGHASQPPREHKATTPATSSSGRTPAQPNAKLTQHAPPAPSPIAMISMRRGTPSVWMVLTKPLRRGFGHSPSALVGPPPQVARRRRIHRLAAV